MTNINEYSPSAMRECLESGLLAPRGFFTDPRSWDTQKKVAERQWQLVAAQSEVGPGQQFAVDVLTEHGMHPVLLTREMDGALHAVSAVCPHRGYIIPAGINEGLKVTCPYHGLKYSCKGVDVGKHGLRRMQVIEWRHGVFVNPSLSAPSFYDFYPELAEWEHLGRLVHHDESQLQVLCHEVVPHAGNILAGTANNTECGHCDPNHPGLLRLGNPYWGGYLEFAEGMFTSQFHCDGDQYLLDSHQTWQGHLGSVLTVERVDDGTFVVMMRLVPTGLETYTLHYWFLSNGKIQKELERELTLIWHATFSDAEDKRLVEESQRGLVLLKQPSFFIKDEGATKHMRGAILQDHIDHLEAEAAK